MITSNKDCETHQRSCSVQTTMMIPDDNLHGIIPGIQHPPEICVDYLSHDWKKEDDIWTSWKVMSKQKKGIANGTRLENASWRTWAKQKYDLKTVNPEKLNWSKDSDVTWLYGPLHTSPNRNVNLPKSPNTEDKLHLMQTSTTKSCLKKKSISDLLRPTIKGKYGTLVSSNSDTQLYKKDRDNNDADLSDCETASTCSSISGPSTPTAEPTKSVMLPTENDGSHHRKIQFNDRVEQCIAVDSNDDHDDSYVSDPESSSDDGIEMKISSKKKRKDCSTICKLAPTKLKEDRMHNNEYSSLYSSRRITTSGSSSSTTTYSTTSATSTTTTHPSSSSSSSSSTTHKPWMDDDDDDDDLDVDDMEFDFPKTILLPSEMRKENQSFPQDYGDDDDGIVDRAVTIASGFRDIINMVFKF